MSRFLPCLPVQLNLPPLLYVKRLAAFVVFERRTLEVHAQCRRPQRRGVRAGAPPDAIAQPFRMRLETQQPWRIGEHRPGVRLGESFSFENLEEDLGMTSGHIGIAL